MLYRIKNVTRQFDKRVVLNLRDLSIERDKIICLLGPNGSGKTTLLEILSFISPSTDGEIWFRDKKVDFNSTDLVSLRRSVVLVQQKPIMFTASVYKNVEYPLKIRKVSRDRRNEMVKQLLDLVGMGSFIHSEAHRLSGGETQRVAIAQALACSPEVILLDEPTSSVDSENRYIIEEIIKEINRDRKISVVFTTHDMTQASRITNEIVFLYNGEISDSIHENIFSARIEKDEDKKYLVLRQGIRLSTRLPVSGSVRISIDSFGLSLYRREEIPEPGENQFKARLIQIAEYCGKIRAMVSVGLPVTLYMEQNEFNAADLKIGSELILEIPEDSVRII